MTLVDGDRVTRHLASRRTGPGSMTEAVDRPRDSDGRTALVVDPRQHYLRSRTRQPILRIDEEEAEHDQPQTVEKCRRTHQNHDKQKRQHDKQRSKLRPAEPRQSKTDSQAETKEDRRTNTTSNA